jgi:hypothetical protein
MAELARANMRATRKMVAHTQLKLCAHFCSSGDEVRR